MGKIIYYLSICLVFVSSCIPVQKLKYFGGDENVQENVFYNSRPPKTIQPYDNIYIRIFSMDEATANLFESSGANVTTQGLNIASYTVSDSGYIDFPFVGNILVTNLTLDEVKKKLEEALFPYHGEVSVLVKFVGNKVTILGEVRQPGEYHYFNDKLNILQAIGFARGIADYGNKEKITLIREKENVIRQIKIDLTQKDILNSEYYYLLPNDVVIVDPVKAKYSSLRNYASISTTATIITTMILVFTTLTNR